MTSATFGTGHAYISLGFVGVIIFINQYLMNSCFHLLSSVLKISYFSFILVPTPSWDSYFFIS